MAVNFALNADILAPAAKLRNKTFRLRKINPLNSTTTRMKAGKSIMKGSKKTAGVDHGEWQTNH